MSGTVAGGVSGAQPPPARGARVHAWFASADGRAVAVLVALPLLLFVVPALSGHPDITSDNLIQNFPLRALSGAQMRAGHLPLWNPYVWSGSPLLGGLNAGSFYPFTFFFVVLAPVAAWVANLLGVYLAGGLGMYALCRQYRLRPLPSLIGALTFTFSGTMAAQIVHLGVVQGMAWMPLLVLAELRLSWAVFGTGPAKASAVDVAPAAVSPAAGSPADGSPAGGSPAAGSPAARWTTPRRHRSSPWPWVAALAALVGLEALTGEPRSIAETEMVAAVVGLWLLLRPYAGVVVTLGRRAAFLGLALVGAAWGVALAAVQLAPGWTFIETSQRAVESYAFFGSGSLRPAWSLLLFVPDLLGGAGHFGQPAYFAHYNLTEVTSYVGLLPLSAALVLLTRSVGRRRSRLASDWGMWLALLALGILFAWGAFTPLGHIWAAIPLFGKTRLQSRNIEIADLALAVLLAFWLDRLWSERASDHGAGVAGWRLGVALLPAVAVPVVCIVTLAAPRAVEGWLDVPASRIHLARGLWPWFVGEIAVAGFVAVLLMCWRRLSASRRRRLLVGVVAADLVLFLLATSAFATRSTISLEPTHADAAAVVGNDGRFAIVQGTLFNGGAVSKIGQTDLNAFSKDPSVQGYGSIVANEYATVTGTHTFDSITGCALARGMFGQLRLSTLLADPSELVRGLGATGKPPSTVPPCPGVRMPGSAARRVLYLGFSATLASTTLVVARGDAGSGRRAAAPVVGVETPTAKTRWPKETVTPTSTGWSVDFARIQRADGIVVKDEASGVAETSTVSGPTGRWDFDGALQEALDTSAWRFTGTYGQLARFKRTTPVKPPVWLAHAVPGSSVHQVSTTEWGTTTDRVTATRPVTVVWSESYLQGWHAHLVAERGGRSEELPVRRDGLVQSVRVPAGRWTLTFTYRAPHLDLGVLGTLIALCGFAAFAVIALLDRRRRRPSAPVSHPVA